MIPADSVLKLPKFLEALIHAPNESVYLQEWFPFLQRERESDILNANPLRMSGIIYASDTSKHI